MKNLKTVILAATLIMSCSLMKAQRNAALTEQQKNFILNTWYESPQESKGDTIVFSTVKHVNLPPADVVGFEYSKLVFSNATDFNVSYWTKCTGNMNEGSGKWSFTSGTSLQIDFGIHKCKNQLTVLEVTGNKLKVIVK